MKNQRLNPAFYALMLAYLIVPVYFPADQFLNVNGPKFLALAVLNLLSLIVFLNDADTRRNALGWKNYFSNSIGIAYSVFLGISLLSFVKALNVSESVINFAKILTVFGSVYALYVIFSSSRDYLLAAATALGVLLVVDCLTVMYYLVEYMDKKLPSIYEIKSVYSNKNIFSAAIFIKLPAALWLVLYSDGWRRKLGWTAFAGGVFGILFLSSRAFYLGLAMLVAALAVYLVYRQWVLKGSVPLKKVLLYAGILVGAVVVFTLVQNFLFPKNEDLYNKGIVERFTDVKGSEERPGGRLSDWKGSLKLIGQNPVLGVGTGNWKVQMLKYQAPEIETFIISHKNHNDFLEVTAETGLPGGIAYLAIFILIVLGFLKSVMGKQAGEEMIRALFMPAFGILAYSVDAMFNFPLDRPEVQSLFAVYVGMAVAAAAAGKGLEVKREEVRGKEVRRLVIRKKLPAVSRYVVIPSVFVVMGVAAVVLAINSKSLYYQNFAFHDEKNNKYSHPSSYFIEGFPAIPNLSCVGAPISSYIARYLINENKGREAVQLLIRDESSPWDGRREYYLSMAYDRMGVADSVKYWGMKALELKPKNGPMVLRLSSRLHQEGKKDEAMLLLVNYLAKVQTNPDAWVLAVNQTFLNGNTDLALTMIDQARKFLPKDPTIANRWATLQQIAQIRPYEGLYNQVEIAVQAAKYAEGLKLVDEFISKKPDYPLAYPIRALCLSELGDHRNCLEAIEKAFAMGNAKDAFMLNLRGKSLQATGSIDAACRDFKDAMDKGSAEGGANYRKYCGT